MRKILLFIGIILLTMTLVACAFAPAKQTAEPTNPPTDTATTEATTQPSGNTAKSKAETEGFMKGFKATEVKVKDMAGAEFVLSEQLGKVVVLNFWASWCPPCNEEIPYFNEVFAEVDSKDTLIVGIDLIDSDKLEDVKAKIAEHSIQYPIYLDEGSVAANDYRVRNIPTTVIVKPDGVIYDVYVGALTKENLLKFIEEAKQ